ncbi:FKBP-type peptidyl-prolyl cis-trans isomerase [Oxalobacter vibrioformis]|uniref:Peptidyl-prolyl cis-trans isomerase n=1 Tax=Oxalobacter vibrioformis TaxID=933080 RepID=A0A9E9LWD1_9BURK|nr:FKBP-type peptidyl-prolyl cis-trans isomerase [Oxalobacter vibrioformis]WAW09902.1 FKBP-type peptidyl-prolyl cis-trans isomerase [Oxalobacter vibrioformis]
MNRKFSSFVTFALVILVGTALAMPQASAQEPAQQAAQPQAAPAQQPQAQPQTQQAQPQAQPAVVSPAATNALPAATNALPKRNPNEITLYNGVKMEVMRAADGPKPAPNAIVHIQYIGHLEDGTEFDRSYSRRYPSIYKLSDVIGCWQTGIPEMNVGSKVKFTCPPGSANGARPVDFIWGDTTLYFIIELIAIVG